MSATLLRHMGDWAGQFDGSLDITPPLGEEQLSALPARRGVLLMAAADDQPIVMLSAADIRSRIRARLRNPDEDEQRRKTADLREITRRIFWKLSTSHFETDLHFLDLASAIWPTTYPSMPAWRPAWFVHVNPAENFPRFVRTQDVFDQPGRYVGPFETARSAERFVEAIQDAFCLCRETFHTRSRGQRCAYGQMGRCVCVCDGTMSMDDYRRLIGRAAAFAAGDRRPLRQELTDAIAAASRTLAFEQAAAVKARLDRLAEFDRPEYRNVAPAEDFRFLILQPSGSVKRIKVFLADQGTIVSLDPLARPLQPEQLQALATRIQARHISLADKTISRWRMGLAAYYLHCSPAKRGIILRCAPDLSAETIADAVSSPAP